jgi:hypothetical protein
MTVANPRRTTVAVAPELLCVGLCRRRKPRTEFRETPWHGRAARCLRCESWSSGEARAKEEYERQAWELAQAREKLRTYQRYARALKLRLLMKSIPPSADVLTAQEKPFYDALERAVVRQTHAWAAVVGTAVREAYRHD